MSSATYLAEELAELGRLRVLGRHRQAGLPQRLAEEVADIFAGCSECLSLGVLGRLSLVRAGKHVGEEPQRYREQQFREWDDEEG
jgi:hypothetical protein